MGFIKHFYNKSFEAYRSLSSSYPEIAFFLKYFACITWDCCISQPLLGLVGSNWDDFDWEWLSASVASRCMQKVHFVLLEVPALLGKSKTAFKTWARESATWRSQQGITASSHRLCLAYTGKRTSLNYNVWRFPQIWWSTLGEFLYCWYSCLNWDPLSI